MDLIGQLGSTLGVNPGQASALAGSVLGGVQGALADKDAGAAAELGEAVPELEGWKAQADQELGAAEEPAAGGLGGLLGGGGGGLLGAAAGALGGEKAQNTLAIVQILGKFDVEPGKAALVAPMLLQFLESRLKPGTLQLVLQVAPLLASARGGDEGGEAGEDKGLDAGDLLGAAGKLFG